VPAHTTSAGEYYWGDASGIIATKVPGYGEFVLAELTLPFLGFRPRYSAFDAAFPP